MLKLLIISIVSLFSHNLLNAQVWSNAISDLDASNDNPYTRGDVKNQNIVVSGIGRGAGLLISSSDGKYGARSWPTTANINTNDYFYFTMIPNSGYQINITNFTFITQRGGGNVGPTAFVFRSSADNYTTNLQQGTLSGTNATPQSISIPINTTYNDTITFRIYAYSSTASSAPLYINSFDISGSVTGIPLPLTLLSFDAEAKQDKAILEWRCVNQKNISHFEVEKSGNKNSFTTTGSVKAQNIAEEMTYSFSEALPGKAKNLLYRLKIYEMDGSYYYSPIAALNTTTKDKTDIYPNPFKDRLVLKNMPGNSNIAVLDIYGRAIWQGKSTDSEVTIDTRSWSNGIYIIRSNDNILKKIIKQ